MEVPQATFFLQGCCLSYFTAEVCHGQGSPCIHLLPGHGQQLGLWLHLKGMLWECNGQQRNSSMGQGRSLSSKHLAFGNLSSLPAPLPTKQTGISWGALASSAAHLSAHPSGQSPPWGQHWAQPGSRAARQGCSRLLLGVSGPASVPGVAQQLPSGQSRTAVSPLVSSERSLAAIAGAAAFKCCFGLQKELCWAEHRLHLCPLPSLSLHLSPR